MFEMLPDFNIETRLAPVDRAYISETSLTFLYLNDNSYDLSADITDPGQFVRFSSFVTRLVALL